MNSSDPRFTAYADGALPPGDSLRFARELAADPEALAELEDIRALQRGLREAFAGQGTAWPSPPPRVAPPAARFSPRRLVLPLVVAACLAAIAAAFIATEVGAARMSARRSGDAAALRRIGLACRVFAETSGRPLPVATDVWDFARRLAIDGGLTEGASWLVEAEAAAPENWDVGEVLAANGKDLAPSFAETRPSFAVLLSGLGPDAPGTTPVAWTRGLRADGTWDPGSPYGGRGGHVVFLDGNVRYFRKIDGRLTRFDGKGATSDIHEALPPGARVGEAR